MTKVLLIAALLITSACAGTFGSPSKPSAWRHVDKVTLAASTAALVCDWAQTRRIAMDGWRAGHTEANVVIRYVDSDKPRASTIDVYFGLVAVTNVALWYVLPSGWRSVVPGVVVGVQTSTIASNVEVTGGLCGSRPNAYMRHVAEDMAGKN